MAHFIEIPAWRLESWRIMTDQNAHGKRLESIADYCATFAEGDVRGDLEDLAGLFNKINARHEMRGSLSQILYETRYGLSRVLYTIIGREFGPEVLKKINETG